MYLKDKFLLETNLISKKKMLIFEIISTYSNEITHIYICMKLHVDMCMKLERYKDSKQYLKGHKDSKRH